MNNPELIKVSEDELSVEAIKQYYASVDWKDKLTAISAVLEEEAEHTLVFTRTKIGADNLSHKLHQRGFKVMAITGTSRRQNARRQSTCFGRKRFKY